MSKLKTFILSSSTLLLLAACGSESTMDPIEEGSNETTEEQVTEENAETTTDQETEATGGMDETADDATDDTSSDTTEESPETSSLGIENQEFKLSLADAVALFNETFPEAEGIHNVQFDVDDGRFEYEMDGFSANSEFELTIDAETGEIIDQETDSDDDQDEVAIDFDQIISPKEAMENALNETGSGYVKEWELETDDGRIYYEIDIENTDSNEDDIDVDALTGDIL